MHSNVVLIGLLISLSSIDRRIDWAVSIYVVCMTVHVYVVMCVCGSNGSEWWQ